MKAKINGNGTLEIEKANMSKRQMCPYTTAFCGDWCPMFGEPYARTQESGVKVTALDLCRGTLLLDSLEDERSRP